MTIASSSLILEPGVSISPGHVEIGRVVMPGTREGHIGAVASREALQAEISRLQAEVKLTREVLEQISARLDELECEEALAQVCEDLTETYLLDE
jgi:hypothetical protein